MKNIDSFNFIIVKDSQVVQWGKHRSIARISVAPRKIRYCLVDNALIENSDKTGVII